MIKGKIKLINDIQTFDSGFQKREFVVVTDEQFPQEVQLELIKDKCSLIDDFKVGQNVNVEYNIRGNEYNGRYFVNLQAWRITQGEAAVATNAAPPVEELKAEDDDLPF